MRPDRKSVRTPRRLLLAVGLVAAGWGVALLGASWGAVLPAGWDVAATVLAGGEGQFAPHPEDGITTLAAPDRARWMQDRLDWLGERPLKRLVLPASHDSAMYEPTFPQSLARTQDLTVYGQLSYGIRYFDLRPQWHGGELYIHHGPVKGPKFSDVLDDVRRFLNEGRRELVILKFSHYEGFGDEAYQSMVRRIQESLGRWLYTSPSGGKPGGNPGGKRLADITLGEYLRQGGAVLVLCDGRFPVDHRRDGIWVYRDWDSPHPEQGDLRVYDRYSNTVSYETMKSDQFGKFSRYDGKCLRRPDVPCDMFLLSWTLTPTTNVRQVAREPNRRLGEAIVELRIPNRFGLGVNLLFADSVESARLTDVAVAQNRK